MFIDFSIRLPFEPTVGQVRPALEGLIEVIGTQHELEVFRQVFKLGVPDGLPIPMCADDNLQSCWMRLGDEILAGVGIVSVDDPSVDPEECGLWLGVDPSRSPGSILFAAVIAGAVAFAVDSNVRDETAAIGLGRAWSTSLLRGRLMNAAGEGFPRAEEILIRADQLPGGKPRLRSV